MFSTSTLYTVFSYHVSCSWSPLKHLGHRDEQHWYRVQNKPCTVWEALWMFDITLLPCWHRHHETYGWWCLSHHKSEMVTMTRGDSESPSCCPSKLLSLLTVLVLSPTPPPLHRGVIFAQQCHAPTAKNSGRKLSPLQTHTPPPPPSSPLSLFVTHPQLTLWQSCCGTELTLPNGPRGESAENWAGSLTYTHKQIQLHCGNKTRKQSQSFLTMTDTATEEDKDPDIELFVKVGV